jgi:hypothetical protein
MSSVESMSGAGVEIPQWFRRLAGQRGGTDASFEIGTGPPHDSRRAEFGAKFQEAALAAGLDPAAANGLQDEIKAAITEALKTSDATTDRRQVIQDAVDGVLEKHGVNLEKFKSQLPSAPGGTGAPPPGPPPSRDARRAEFQTRFAEAAIAAGLDPTKADGLQDEIEAAISEVLQGSDGTTDPRQAIQDAVDNLLKEHGVDLAMFRSQLQSALGGARLVDEQA